jgi:hypothetical protein
MAFVACGPPPVGKVAEATGTNYVSLQLFGYDDMQAEHFQRVQGQVFLVHFDPADPQNLNWVNCAAAATYTYGPSDTEEQDFIVESEADLHTKLPLGAVNLSGYFAHGSKLHVRYATAGSYEVSPNFTIPRACSAATHYVSTFSVGAYAIHAMGDDRAGTDITVQGVGAGGDVGDSQERHAIKGDLQACARGARASQPVEGCRTPLKILLVPIGKGQWAEDQPAARVADPTLNPGTLPGTVPQPQEVHVVTDLHAQEHSTCYQGMRLSGEALRDIGLVTEACGRRLGLTSLGPPISNVQGEDDPMQKFTVHLENGGCYRIFGNADSSIADFDTGLIDDSDQSFVAKDLMQDNAPMLNPDGPFCVQHTGTYSLIVSVKKGRGRYAVQLWKMQRSGG